MSLAAIREDEIELVDPERLASGTWCHRAQKTLGQGDISASYSADRIGMGEPVRKPFSWNGALWVCVAIHGRCGIETAQAYRLVHPQIFDGRAVPYDHRVRSGDEARADPRGFYHGMTVRYDGSEYVLSGPPITFAPGETAQLALF